MRVIEGEEAAFDQFFHLYHPKIYRYCRSKLVEADAEEVAIDAVRQALRRMETYRGEASLLTWTFQIARSQLASFWRRTKRHEAVVSIEDNQQISAELDAMAMQLADGPEAKIFG